MALGRQYRFARDERTVPQRIPLYDTNAFTAASGSSQRKMYTGVIEFLIKFTRQQPSADSNRITE